MGYEATAKKLETHLLTRPEKEFLEAKGRIKDVDTFTSDKARISEAMRSLEGLLGPAVLVPGRPCLEPREDDLTEVPRPALSSDPSRDCEHTLTLTATLIKVQSVLGSPELDAQVD